MWQPLTQCKDLGRGRIVGKEIRVVSSPCGGFLQEKAILAQKWAHKSELGGGEEVCSGSLGRSAWERARCVVGFRLGQQAGGDGKASSHPTGKFSSLSPNHLGSKVAITEAEEQSSMEKRMGGAAFHHLTTAAVGKWGARKGKGSPGSVHDGVGALLEGWAADGELSFGTSGWRRKERLKDDSCTVKAPKEGVFFPQQRKPEHV